MVTDSQVRRLKRLSKTEETKDIAAAKAGMDPKTARKYLELGKMPGEEQRNRAWRTRLDPFAEVWDEAKAEKELNPGLEAKTLFEEMQRRYPGKFTDGQLRTLQRKFKEWRATEGPAREVFFAQVHEPGRLCQSDFTHMTSLGVTISRQSFPHLTYHFVLTYSNWEAFTICHSESFESLSEGVQNALWELGGVPREHRTDRLTAAVNNLSDQDEFTRRYDALLQHYGLNGQKIQAGRANENGDVEQRHYRFKRAIEQSLLLRGSRDFTSVEQYRLFLKRVQDQLNAGRRPRLIEDMKALRALPDGRLDSVKRSVVRVDSGSLISVGNNNYSVSSRLIGERVEVRVTAETVAIWYASRKVDELPRLRGRGKHRVDYRHIIDWLVRKPGAFENYRYKEDLFPTSRFRMAYDALRQSAPSSGTRQYLAILYLAATEGESRVDAALRILLERTEEVTADGVAGMLQQAEVVPLATDVNVVEVSLASFDELFRAATEVVQ
ncbi:MAG: IS21 family transposase [Acidobacteriota bacterium]|nr:IS21 family transposase [Acidobacteriota bacterium]